MSARAKVVDLRKLLTERFPATPLARPARLQTGLAFLDQATDGGLPKSAITELISPQTSAGSASIIAGLLHQAQRDRYFTALVDGCDSFDPTGLDPSCLRHLLWVRCRKTADALKAADLLLRDGNFPLVIVDLVLNPREETRKIPQTNWYRLQRLVETAPTSCLILTRWSMVGSAQLKLSLENSWTVDVLENENAISQLSVRVQRSHIKLALG